MKVKLQLEFHVKERKPGIMTDSDAKNLLKLEEIIIKSIKEFFPSSSYHYKTWPEKEL